MREMKHTILIVAILAVGCATPHTRDKWRTKAERVQIGMTRAEVSTLLPRHVQSPRIVTGTGSSQSEVFWVDPEWKVTVAYDYTGVQRNEEGTALSDESAANRVVSTPLVTREDMPPPIEVETIETQGIEQIAEPYK